MDAVPGLTGPVGLLGSTVRNYYLYSTLYTSMSNHTYIHMYTAELYLLA